MLLNENEKALVAKDQSQVPKMLIKRDTQGCIQRLDRFTIWDQPQKAVFYIQDWVVDSFEIQRMRISCDETKVDRFFEKRFKKLLLRFLSYDMALGP